MVSKPRPMLGLGWALPGHTVSGFYKRHMVCESAHLPPERWSKRLILCNAGGNRAAPWPPGGNEDSRLRAEPGPAAGRLLTTSAPGVQCAGSQAGFLCPLQQGPAHLRPELVPSYPVAFQRACQISYHSGDRVLSRSALTPTTTTPGYTSSWTSQNKSGREVLRITERPLQKADTGLFAMPCDWREGTFSWSLSTPQWDKAMRKQEYGPESLGPLRGQLAWPSPSCVPAESSRPPTGWPEGLNH